MSQPSPTTALPARTSPVMGVFEYGLISLQSMLWGSTFFLVALVGQAVPPMTIMALRLLPASLILLVVITWLGLRLPATRRDWGLMLLMAAFNNVVPGILIIYAQREVTGGIAAVFNATAPLFATLLAPMFVPEEYFSWRRIAGIMAGICGVAILISGGSNSVSLASAALLLSAACCYATANIMTRRFFPGFPPFVIACAHMIAGLVLACVMVLIFEAPFSSPPPSINLVLTIALMGTLGSAFASLCHFTVLRRAGPTNAMLVTIILPLTPIVLGTLFLGDQITARQGLGALCIACALLIIDGRILRMFTAKPGRGSAP